MGTKFDWSEFKPKPSNKMRARYRRWKKYLSDSKLDSEEIHERSICYAERGEEPPGSSVRRRLKRI